MRYGADAPKGVIDYLLTECMLWGKANGFRWFSLGMAPLAGLEEHALAPTWHKLGRVVQRYGEMFYPFEGLRKYKEKFLPEWRPRHFAARPAVHSPPPRAVTAVLLPLSDSGVLGTGSSELSSPALLRQGSGKPNTRHSLIKSITWR